MDSITYVEIPSTDIRKSQRFFDTIFGWKFLPEGPESDVAVLTQPETIGALLYPVKKLPVRGATILHVKVDNIDETLKKVRRARGKVFRKKAEVPDKGWIAYITTPDGYQLAVWQPYWMMAA